MYLDYILLLKGFRLTAWPLRAVYQDTFTFLKGFKLQKLLQRPNASLSSLRSVGLKASEAKASFKILRKLRFLQSKDAFKGLRPLEKQQKDWPTARKL